MRADYYYFAPTGGRYQTVFRGTLPRRCSIKRSQRGNNSATSNTLFTTLRLRLFPLTYRAWELRGVRRSRWDNTLPVKHDFFHHILYNFLHLQHTLYLRFCTVRCIVYTTDTYTQKPPSTIVFGGFVSAKYSSVLNFAPCTMLSASTFALCRFRPRCRCCPRFEARLRATP